MLKIIVDSTCDLPQELLEKYDIKMIPLRVYLGEKEYKDKATIRVEEVYDAMRNGITPMTSQPRPSDIKDMFLSFCKDNIAFIYLAFSSALSCTYQLAQSICKELKANYPDMDMEVVDSKGGSLATGLIALQAAKLAKSGYDFKTIVKQVKSMVEHIEHIFTITDLKWLIKGGRISKGEGMIGSILDIKPILDVKNGVMEVIRKVRGKKKALNMVADILAERIKNFPEQVIGISHADDLETVSELVKIIKSKIGEKAVMICKIGSVLGSHIGIGGVGIFFLNKKPDLYIK